MKTILVIDVPAENGGALTVLNEFHNKAMKDKSKQWIFVTSLPKLEEAEHLRNIRFPWVKKSWAHRYYFDHFIAPKLVKKNNVDEILSLQNVIIPRIKEPQTVYVHQPLPFIDRKFSIVDNPKFWIYQNIIGSMIKSSMKKAENVIVQTEWMKEASIRKTGIDPEKITLETPGINIDIKKKFEVNKDSLRTFFYPASHFLYKNHKLILEAAELLKSRKVKNYRIILTLKGDENKNIIEIYKKATISGLPIEFIGNISYKKVLNYYSKSILVFPSYIETFGLPLLEARLHESPVLASDMPFSHEILDGYEKVEFFNTNDALTLSNYMEKAIQKADNL